MWILTPCLPVGKWHAMVSSSPSQVLHPQGIMGRWQNRRGRPQGKGLEPGEKLTIAPHQRNSGRRIFRLVWCKFFNIDFTEKGQGSTVLNLSVVAPEEGVKDESQLRRPYHIHLIRDFEHFPKEAGIHACSLRRDRRGQVPTWSRRRSGSATGRQGDSGQVTEALGASASSSIQRGSTKRGS